MSTAPVCLCLGQANLTVLSIVMVLDQQNNGMYKAVLLLVSLVTV